MFNEIEEALADLQAGKVIILVDDEDRENEGDFVVLAEKATPEVINFMATHGRGLICTTITEERALRLNLHPMVHENTDHHGTAFTVSIDHKQASTGISAFERAGTIRELFNDHSVAADFKRPGHVFPLIAKPGGVFNRPGHTEASVDLAEQCGAIPGGVICEIMNEDGTMARVPELQVLAKKHELKLITIADLIRYRKEREMSVIREAEVKMPTTYGDYTLIGYSNSFDQLEHLALVKGEWNENDAVLVRIHSECMTGDVFGSKRCDCGEQLHAALSQIEEEGAGVLLYMRQEGRGIGLFNKLRAYKLQEEGYDTVEANIELGFPAEMREYGVSVEILRDLGIKRLRLLTNNPDKITGLAGCDLDIVERMPIQMPAVKENEEYLETKKIKMGHLFV